MNWSYKHILLILFILPGSELFSIENKDINWKEEIDGLKRELTGRHVDLFFYSDSVSFNKGLENVALKAPGKSVLEVAVMLQQVVAKLGDINTRVNFNYLIDKNLILPFQCYWFQEGIYATSYWKDYESLDGKRIVGINGHPIQQVIDSLSTLISGVNPSLVRYHIPRMLVWAQVLDFFGFAQLPEIVIDLEDAQGTISSLKIPLPSPESDRILVGPDPLPLGWQDKNSFFNDRYFPESKLYYIQYNKCWSREAEEEFGSGASALFMPSFREFEKDAIKTIKKQQIEKMVLDLRFNSGGNPLQWTKFVSKLQRSRIGEQAEIYLLVGRRTSAEALENALDIIKAFSPLVVGEDSGGKPNHFGEMKRFVLTTSNLVVSYSTKYIRLMENDPPAIIPDKPVLQSYAGYIMGTDEAVEFISNRP